MKEVMRVVSGLAVNAARGDILMGLRSAHTMRPHLWELPGGKVNANETPVQALIREWKEELGVTIWWSQVGPLLATAMLDVDRRYTIELYPVVVDANFAPRPIDHQELRWVGPAYAMAYLPCSPGFYLHYPQIMEWFEESVRGFQP